MTAPQPAPSGALDLGKPMRWKNGKTVTVVHHGKAGAALKTEGAQWPHWYTPTELDELFENIPPEPPKVEGPEEIWAGGTATGNTWGAWGITQDMHDGRPCVRYLRADLAEKLEARIHELNMEICALAEKCKVKPLTKLELDVFLEALAHRNYHTRDTLRRHWIDYLADRGIEVGE